MRKDRNKRQALQLCTMWDLLLTLNTHEHPESEHYFYGGVLMYDRWIKVWPGEIS